MVTSSEDIIPGEAGKLVGPGRNKPTCGFGWRTGRLHLQTSLVRPPTLEHVANSRHGSCESAALGSLQLEVKAEGLPVIATRSPEVGEATID